MLAHKFLCLEECSVAKATMLKIISENIWRMTQQSELFERGHDGKQGGNMYSFNSKVRYSETNNKGNIYIGSIVDYLQDCSLFQSEALGIGVEYLKEKKKAWILSSWQIVIQEDLKLGDEISIGTQAYDFKGIYGYRNFCIKDNKDKFAVLANSVWVLVSTETGMPIKVEPEDALPYGKAEKFQMDYADRKIKITGEPIKKDSFAIRKYHIDTNDHVNNAWYIKFAQEYLENDYKIRQIRAEYKMAAKYGNIVYPVLYLDKDKVTVALNNEENKTYAVVEFTK